MLPVIHAVDAEFLGLGVILSSLSSAYSCQQSCNCFVLVKQAVMCALLFALANAGNNIAARIAMMAMTTRSSIKVKAAVRVNPMLPRAETIVPSFITFKARLMKT